MNFVQLKSRWRNRTQPGTFNLQCVPSRTYFLYFPAISVVLDFNNNNFLDVCSSFIVYVCISRKHIAYLDLFNFFLKGIILYVSVICFFHSTLYLQESLKFVSVIKFSLALLVNISLYEYALFIIVWTCHLYQNHNDIKTTPRKFQFTPLPRADENFQCSCLPNALIVWLLLFASLVGSHCGLILYFTNQ